MVQKRTVLYFIALLLLFSAAVLVEAGTLRSLSAPGSDTWQHLSSGIWAMQHHVLPQLGQQTLHPPSSHVSPCWLYDWQLATAYQLLGLAVIPATQMTFQLSIALLTFLLAGGLYGRIWRACALSVLAQYCISSVYVVAGGCSMLLLATLVLLLVAARQSGNVKLFYWLPPIFLLWANVDFQFVYGIITLALFTAASFTEELCQIKGWGSASKLPAKTIAIALAASLAASFVTPTFFRSYEIFFARVSSPINQYLKECDSMAFHRPQDYLVMLLVMGAFLSLGYRRTRMLALPFILILATLWSFHARRDAWLVVIIALAVYGGEGADLPTVQRLYAVKRAGLQALASSMVVLVIAVALIPHKPSELLARAGKEYPVAAAEVIRSQHLPQPLFNALEWGGYLNWALSEYPVTYNSDTALYDEQMAVRYYRAMKVDDPPQQLAELQNSATVLLPKSSILGQALANLPGYHTVYSDDVAILLVKN